MSANPVVYVVDDDEAVRDSLRWLVESVHLRVETFDSAQGFLDNLEANAAGCLVLDVRMPEISGLELQQRLNDLGITLPVIIVTGHADVPMAVSALKAGAVDFVEKPLNYQSLLDRIQRAIARDQSRRADRAQGDATRERLNGLSPRERQVLDRVVAGRLNKQIAEDLGISPKTVEMHRANVMQKMVAESLADLVRMVVLVEGI